MYKLGSKVSYTEGIKVKKRIEGIVVRTPINKSKLFSNFIIEVWLSNRTENGDNNCEHFHINAATDMLKVRHIPETINEFSVGNVLNTKYGKAIIVSEEEDDIIVFLYRENNIFEPLCTDENLYHIDEDPIFYNFFDENIKDEQHFKKETHCLHLLKSQLQDYLIK